MRLLVIDPGTEEAPPCSSRRPTWQTHARRPSTARHTESGNRTAKPSPTRATILTSVPLATRMPYGMRGHGRRDVQCFRRSALIAQGIEHRFPKPCVAGSNPAGGTVREWPILPPPAQTAPSHLSVSYPGCPRHAGLYCSLMHANCTTTVPSRQTPAASVARRTGARGSVGSRAEPWPRVATRRSATRGPPRRGRNEQARRRRSRNSRPLRPPPVTTALACPDPRSLCTCRPVYQRVRGSSP